MSLLHPVSFWKQLTQKNLQSICRYSKVRIAFNLDRIPASDQRIVHYYCPAMSTTNKWPGSSWSTSVKHDRPNTDSDLENASVYFI